MKNKRTSKEKLQVDKFAYLNIYDKVFEKLSPIKKNLITDKENKQ